MIDDVKQLVATLPRRHGVLIYMAAAVDDYEIEQLAHQVKHPGDRQIGDPLRILEPSGGGQQIDSRRMLSQRRLELDGVEFAGEFDQRRDSLFGVQMEHYVEPAVLQVEVNHRRPLAEGVAHHQSQVGAERAYTDTADEAGDPVDQTAALSLRATAPLAQLH